MSDQLSIKVTIADRSYPLTIKREEEEERREKEERKKEKTKILMQSAF